MQAFPSHSWAPLLGFQLWELHLDCLVSQWANQWLVAQLLGQQLWVWHWVGLV